MSITNKIIHLAYYAILKEQCGTDKETVTTNTATAQELYDELQTKYHFTLSTESLKVAVNDMFCSWETELKDNDHVVFIPPVSGG